MRFVCFHRLTDFFCALYFFSIVLYSVHDIYHTTWDSGSSKDTLVLPSLQLSSRRHHRPQCLSLEYRFHLPVLATHKASDCYRDTIVAVAEAHIVHTVLLLPAEALATSRLRHHCIHRRAGIWGRIRRMGMLWPSSVSYRRSLKAGPLEVRGRRSVPICSTEFARGIGERESVRTCGCPY